MEADPSDCFVAQRPDLVDPDLVAWFALRRARGGGVAVTAAGRWLDHGRPIPRYLSLTLDGLTAAGQLALGPAAATTGRRPVTVTDDGHARYAALCRRERLGNLDVRMLTGLSKDA
ncbi:MAG: hypothetical protein ACRDRZ_10190 [Pseudonocardiaceae bacterium]